jgi:predicted nucleic acid-binding protein
MIVVDASVALAWCFEDEKHAAALDALDAIAASRGTVPWHWWLEVSNGLLVARRRRRLRREPAEILAALAALPLRVDTDALFAGAGNSVPALAETHGLSSYDAAYLELALRAGLPLATLDADLAHAARVAGVALTLSAWQ